MIQPWLRPSTTGTTKALDVGELEEVLVLPEEEEVVSLTEGASCAEISNKQGTVSMVRGACTLMTYQPNKRWNPMSSSKQRPSTTSGRD